MSNIIKSALSFFISGVFAYAASNSLTDGMSLWLGFMSLFTFIVGIVFMMAYAEMTN